MKSSSTSISTSHNRCQHLSPAGRRCSQPVCSLSPAFCFTHKPLASAEDKLLLQELTLAAGPLNSPEDVSRVLGRIFVALLEDRISLKKAGTLGFLGQMLIRSHREIEYYKKTHRQNEKEAEATEHHRLFLQQQDERRARIEAHHAELRRAEAEQAEQAAKEAAKAARKEAKEAAKKRAAAKPVAQASACVPSSDAPRVERGTSAAAFRTSDASPSTKDNPANQAVTASNASLQQPTAPPPPQPDLNHFFPIDPTLASGRQDHSKNIPPPGAEELRWRELSRQYAHARRRL